MAGGNTVLYLLQGGIFLCRRKKQSSITKNFVISGQKQVDMEKRKKANAGIK